MADKQHLEILGKGVLAWNDWRRDNPGISVDLREADLSERKCKTINLERADLSGADLRAAHLSAATFKGSKLIGAKLRRARLVGSNLSSTDFKDADLSLVDLTGAQLFDANLSGANLNLADLTVADLAGAKLTKANLTGANFSGAGLDLVDVEGSLLGRTIFAFTSLKHVKGLPTCEHSGPSCLDFATLIASNPLPEAFLGGCGLPDDYIRYISSFVAKPIEFYSCFISYSHADKPFARRVHDALQGRGIRCWLDEHQLVPGDSIYEEIDRGIRIWDKVLLCCSESSLSKSWWVDNEVQNALKKEQRLFKERGKMVLALIPLNLDGYLFKWRSGMATQIQNRLAADFTGWDTDNTKFEAQLERIVKALRADPNARELPPASRL